MAPNNAKDKIVTPRQVNGISLNVGIGLGHAVLHQPHAIKTIHEKVDLINDIYENELSRLDHAIVRMIDGIQLFVSQQSPDFSSQYQSKPPTESLDILNMYLLLANDPSWKRQLRNKVQEGMSAVNAVDQVLQSIQNKLGKSVKPSHWQDRISDFADLSARLKRYLKNSEEKFVIKSENFPIIVIADRIGPAELLEYDRERLAGLVLVEQSQISHVVIVARSLGIPIIGGVKSALSEVNTGDSVLIDGNEGHIYIHPIKEIIRRFDVKTPFKKIHNVESLLETTAHLPSQTLDGISISLFLNAGLVEDVNHIEKVGAEGIGLYRTEISFMMRSKLPNVTEQTKLYREIMKRAGNYPVVFRTLDVGGDKVLPYLKHLTPDKLIKHKPAPRIFFNRPILLRYQLRALIRACRQNELIIKLPMVTEVNEVILARQILDSEVKREHFKGNPIPVRIMLGAMIEVPSLVNQLPQLFPHVDFLSVGSNDLFQFFYAIDREAPKASDRQDVLSPTFLTLLQSIQNQCFEAGVPLSICGEMAARPLEAIALIGLGYRYLSMSAAAIPVIKNIIRKLSYQEIADYMSVACTSSRHSIRHNLRHFAQDHGIYHK